MSGTSSSRALFLGIGGFSTVKLRRLQMIENLMNTIKIMLIINIILLYLNCERFLAVSMVPKIPPLREKKFQKNNSKNQI